MTPSFNETIESLHNDVVNALLNHLGKADSRGALINERKALLIAALPDPQRIKKAWDQLSEQGRAAVHLLQAQGN